MSDASKHFTAGLAPSFKGPFEIAKVLDNNQYELKTLSGERTGIFAGDQLKVCFIWFQICKTELHKILV